MDMILISESKLKVMLSAKDMQELSLNSDTIDYDNTETRRAFWNILDEAKHKTGFDAAESRVFIQVYPSRSGGCELYVTKLAKGEQSDAQVDCRVKHPSLRHRKELYRFFRLDTLLSACARLSDFHYAGESAAYADGTRYYLSLAYDTTEPIKARTILFGPYSFLTEYGETVGSDIAGSYISEHCICICRENAVRQLAGIR